MNLGTHLELSLSPTAGTRIFKPYLKDQNAKTFLSRLEFKDFVDGIGAWKWSTDQTLLNYFLKKYKVPVKHMSWQWNGLYGSVPKIKECFFVHFFLKDKLPSKGENVKELIKEAAYAAFNKATELGKEKS